MYLLRPGVIKLKIRFQKFKFVGHKFLCSNRANVFAFILVVKTDRNAKSNNVYFKVWINIMLRLYFGSKDK